MRDASRFGRAFRSSSTEPDDPAITQPVNRAPVREHGKVQDRELSLVCGPFSAKRESGGNGHGGELLDRVFVRVLGADGFARLKLDGFAAQRDQLCLAADQVHFHSPQLRVVAGLMEKLTHIKVRASSRLMRRSRLRLNSAVTPSRSLYAASIVAASFFQVDADQQSPPVPHFCVMRRSNAPVSSGVKLPIVDPGK